MRPMKSKYNKQLTKISVITLSGFHCILLYLLLKNIKKLQHKIKSDKLGEKKFGDLFPFNVLSHFSQLIS